MTKPLAENVPVPGTAPASWLDALSEATGCDVVVLRRDGTLAYATPDAYRRLGVSDPTALAVEVRRFREGVRPQDYDDATGALSRPSILPLPRGGTTVDKDEIVLIGEPSSRVDQSDQDDVVIDAALWRAQASLSPHWVHALRGSLNAASLNVALLRSVAPAEPDASDARMWETLKDEIRSLDRSLTWFLDRSSVEEAVTSDGSDLQPVIDLVRAQLEPMAKKRQVLLDFRDARQSFIVHAEAVRTHAVLLLLCLDALEHARARATLRVSTRVTAPKRVAILIATIVDPEAGAAAGPASAADRDQWRDAAQRAARAIGGELSIDAATTRLEIAAS